MPPRRNRALRLIRWRVTQVLQTVRTDFGKRRAEAWSRLYHLKYQLMVRLVRYRAILITALLAALIAGSSYWIPALQTWLQSEISEAARLNGLQSLFLALGSSLVGAAAIVSSLVLFSMQVNVERMPHGLFRRLSTDFRLLGAFAGTFLLALIVAALSLIPNVSFAGFAVFGALWATVLILVLFLYGYRRALRLVNPRHQLRLVADNAQREFRTWSRRAARAACLSP